MGESDEVGVVDVCSDVVCAVGETEAVASVEEDVGESELVTVSVVEASEVASVLRNEDKREKLLSTKIVLMADKRRTMRRPPLWKTSRIVSWAQGWWWPQL